METVDSVIASIAPPQDVYVTFEIAAEILGVGLASIENYARAGKIPLNEESDPPTFLREHVEKARELRNLHGGHKWTKHVPWEIPEPDSSNSEDEMGGGTTSSSLAHRIVTKAKEVKEKGNFEMASMLFELVCDEYDFNQG